MALKGITVFLSAFLLFLVQPIIAKLILPRFGGSVAVWATCLVFFQAALMLGYALAHQLVLRGHYRALKFGHIALLLGSLALLPIVPAAHLPGVQQVGPAAQILVLLVLTLGLPFTLLAMTSPLLQAWMADARDGANPYRLFAVSNLASLAALLAYPWLIEPWLHTATQATAWSAAYAAYVVLLCLISLRRRSALGMAEPAAGAGPAQAVRWAVWLGWFALAALGSYALVALTNHLTQNIPSFPMMWVLPLVIYLLSFALCFDSDRWYAPRLFRAATLVAVLALCAVLVREREIKNIGWHIAIFLAGLFILCMYCHGELARSRPPAARLTHFYLAVSAGGVFGGAVVALGAPAVLSGYFEVEIGLVLLALAVSWRCRGSGWRWLTASAVVVVCALATTAWRVDDVTSDAITLTRNFYGVVRVHDLQATDPEEIERELVHGRIMHGQQFLAPQRRREPTSYYTATSGVGRLLGALDGRRLEVGAIGLGAGTIATYGKPGDHYRFFEIDEAIVRAAHKYFSFLADSPATVDVRVGDGRLLLQAEAPGRFDVLVVDAFSGDAIPVHLLTREAVKLYRERLAPGGVIALHVSNSHLDLRAVVGRIAQELGLQWAYVVDAEGEGNRAKSESHWILLARDRSVLDLPAILEATLPLPDLGHARAWTDDYSNILQVMSFGRGF